MAWRRTGDELLSEPMLAEFGDANTVKPVCNDHLLNKVYYLWFIQ